MAFPPFRITKQVHFQGRHLRPGVHHDISPSDQRVLAKYGEPVTSGQAPSSVVTPAPASAAPTSISSDPFRFAEPVATPTSPQPVQPPPAPKVEETPAVTDTAAAEIFAPVVHDEPTDIFSDLDQTEEEPPPNETNEAPPATLEEPLPEVTNDVSESPRSDDADQRPTGASPKVCEQCGAEFDKQSELRKHQLAMQKRGDKKHRKPKATKAKPGR